MYEDHPIFNTPTDNTLIWRYMDFTKFISLLETSSLFFAQGDKLGDPFEGSFPKPNIRSRFYQNIPRQVLNDITKFRMYLLKCTTVNCWHQVILNP